MKHLVSGQLLVPRLCTVRLASMLYPWTPTPISSNTSMEWFFCICMVCDLHTHPHTSPGPPLSCQPLQHNLSHTPTPTTKITLCIWKRQFLDRVFMWARLTLETVSLQARRCLLTVGQIVSIPNTCTCGCAYEKSDKHRNRTRNLEELLSIEA